MSIRPWLAAYGPLAAVAISVFTATPLRAADTPTSDPLSINAKAWYKYVSNVDVFYQVEKRLRAGDKSVRRELVQMVADGDEAQVVFGALLLLRNGLATVADLAPYRLRIFDAMNRLWEGPEVASYPFRRELLYRMRHAGARADTIPLAEKTYVEMLRADDVWGNAGCAVWFINCREKAFAGKGIEIFKAALRDSDRQASQIAFCELTRLAGVAKMAAFEPYVDAAVESLASDRIYWHMGYANAIIGTAVLFRLDPFPRKKLAAAFTGKDAQADLVATAILSVRAPDADADARIHFCAAQMKQDKDKMNAEVAFTVLKKLGQRAQPALRHALAGEDPQQIALALLALADEGALPADLDAEALLAKLLNADGPIHTYAIPEAALVLERRAPGWVKRMADSATTGSKAADFFRMLLNPASDRGDIEALFGPASLAYRRKIPMGHRLMEYLSPAGYEFYIDFFDEIQKRR